MNQPHSDLFKWRLARLNSDNPSVRFIRITASRAPLELGELALFAPDGRFIAMSPASSPDAPELFDEQRLVPSRPTYMNSMYFDEIYHGRTAYEYLQGVSPYETTHPPLGKGFIAASVYVFGMTPFGWRFVGALFGVAMLLVMYVFLKNMFGKTVVATCGTLLLGFDFMRFVQTRIATIDTYGVFFILLAFFFMYRHITTDPDAPFRRSLAPLALSGISFGIGCASKWIVAFAGIGLAVIYVIRLVQLSKHYSANDRPGFGAYLIKTLLFSALFFGVVPAIIYCLSYIPVGLANGMTLRGGMLWDPGYYRIIWDNQVLMLTYHGDLVLGATHPYSSVWWQWILNTHPILYVNDYFGDLRSSFGAFGNPVVWWGGFLAMVVMAVRAVKFRDGKALFLLIGFLAQLLPWVAVSRILFIYHYFPSTLFLVPALAHLFNAILEAGRARRRLAVYSYPAVAGVLFAVFYPALTGVLAPHWYFRSLLRWFPDSWPF
jgi:dolichyl-phosphate-mannose--protein O-mannosyl transferase